MSIIPESLRVAMARYAGEGTKMVVLVIDEQGAQIPEATLAAQIAVLNKAVQLKVPIWLVELNPSIINPAPGANRPTVGTLAQYRSKIITKPHLNAFASNAQPNLHAELQQAGATALVVMGYHVNCCVKATSVGGPDRPGGKVRPGATQLGYMVLTSAEICRPFEDAPWWREPGVRFYEMH